MGKETDGEKNTRVGGALGSVLLTACLVILSLLSLGLCLGLVVVWARLERITTRLHILEGQPRGVHHSLSKTGYSEAGVLVERARREAEAEAEPEPQFLDRKSLTLKNVLNPVSPIKDKIEGFSEDGVPVVNKKYKSYDPDATGFRVYNAWFRHNRENKIRGDPRLRAKHTTDRPIRAHHRKSAAWSSDIEEDDFFDFGNSVYSDEGTTIIKKNSAFNVGKNRAKITNPKEYRAAKQRYKEAPSTVGPTPSTPSEMLNAHMKDKVDPQAKSIVRVTAKEQSSVEVVPKEQPRSQEVPLSMKRKLSGLRARGLRNRAGLRSRGGRLRHGSSRGMVGAAAVHFEADVMGLEGPDYEGAGRLKVSDSQYRDWTPSRWSRKLHMDKKFPLVDGAVTVGAPGLYYIYAQINYLDEHDVNAFQVTVNDNPLFLCTAMTHTPHFTTKANTCFTGGVTFLEQGDKVSLRNLEDNRFAVMLPSHSFFGLVQLSGVGI